ncbi:MAG: UDP-N-acetylmuramoyl-tripeptide--D-alanyl-D-alanine ligase [Desulfobacteraceae bacterium]|nr:MAG: UDP-N-acetylmuramoyl-tripeptide--D-alanyl-D-alanine ligase [Desulfobacteraceae bacterium]
MSARWGEITAGEIAAAIGGRILSGSPETLFTALGTDSRKIVQGQLFWALKGENHDGHNYVPEAIRLGAAGAVVREDRIDAVLSSNGNPIIAVPDTLKGLGDLASWWRHQYPVTLAAITGSMGKTTTKEMTSAIVGIGKKTLSNQGNFNNLIGLPLSIFLLDQEHRAVVLEMGMNRRGEIARLTEIADPDVGLITNVARVHLEGLGNIMGVARAKVELLEKMSSDATAILNGDDGLLMKTASPFGRKITTFGLSAGNDVHARNVRNLGRDGSAFDLCHQGHTLPVRLPVPGQHNVMNALAASAIALSFGVPYEHISAALSEYVGVKGRFAVTTLPSGVVLVDDTYNSNPTSLRTAMEHLKSLAPEGGRILIGLGDMLELGAETEPAHLEAGAQVAKLGATLFVAMGEQAELMIKGAVLNGFSRDRTARAGSHEEMVQIFRNELKKGDLLFLKGSRRIGLDRVARTLREGALQGGTP